LLPRRFLPAWRKLAKVSLVIVILLIVVLPMLLPQANIIERLVVPPVRAILGLFGGLF
jgi:hypothetical protein